MNTFDKVAKIIADNRDMKMEEIKPESTFADIGLDSLDTVELVMQMEDEFGVSIELNENIKCVADIVNVIDGEAK